MSTVTTLIPDDAYLFDVANLAMARGEVVITNGERFAISKSIPPGWSTVPVGFKQPAAH